MSQRPSTTYADKFNLMLIGDDTVGKTSILERYGRGIFQTEHKQTHGVRDCNKDFTYEKQTYLFKLWDTVGQEKFSKTSKAFYQKADCIMIVCAINNKESFLNISKWMNNISDSTEISTVQIILISNKCDLEDERQVGLDEIRQKAEELSIEYYETSACTGYGIEDAFEAIFKKAIGKVYKGSPVKKNNEVIKEEVDTSSFKTGCVVF